MPLTFDEPTHTYTLNGRRLPSVTTIINSVVPGWKASDYYLTKGQALHHGCRLFDEKRLDWATVAPEIAGKIRAWERFRKALPIEIVSAETPLASERLQFAGTPDRVLFNGEPILCDLKSSIAPQVRLQLAGYCLLVGENTRRKPTRAVAVELREDETYSCLWLNSQELRRAENQFLACLTVYGFLSEHSLLPKENERE